MSDPTKLGEIRRSDLVMRRTELGHWLVYSQDDGLLEILHEDDRVLRKTLWPELSLESEV